MCTCIALTKWDAPVACENFNENVENFRSMCYNFTANKTSVTVSPKQHEYDRVTHCTFSVDFKEIKTISQSLPSTCASAIWNREFSNTNLDIFFPKMYGIIDRHLPNDAWKYTKLTPDGMLNMSIWYKPRLTFTAGFKAVFYYSICCYAEQTVKQTVQLSAVWEAMTPMWRHCKDQGYNFHALSLHSIQVIDECAEAFTKWFFTRHL